MSYCIDCYNFLECLWMGIKYFESKFYSIDSNLKDKNEVMIKLLIYKRLLSIYQVYRQEKKTIEFHKYPEDKPKKKDFYLVAIKEYESPIIRADIAIFYDNDKVFEFDDNTLFGKVIAWAKLPEPYNPKENNNESR